MSGEQQPREVSSLHFDIKSRRLMTLLEDQTILQFTLTPDLRLVYDGHFKPAEAVQREAVVHQVEQPAPTTPSPRTPERQQVETLTGRLVDDVKPGRIDSRGNPTSWAPALLHIDGQETAQRVAISFHRNTMQVALDNLHNNDQLTVEGYLRPAPEPKPGEEKRMDSFSAFRLINYPGKPQKQES